jgi:hypothetical protein
LKAPGKLIEWIQHYIQMGWVDVTDLIESFEIAVEAMKKQDPMKPLSSFGEYTCPMCEMTVAEGDEYCWNCGQKIDWED